jgi:tetratricopeptide (TPR) repeat protein
MVTITKPRAIALALTIMCAGAPMQFADAKKTHKTDVAPVQDRSTVMTDLGIDGETLHLINLGKWKEAQERLKTLADKETGVTRTKAWLAFAYMYRSQCDALTALNDSLKSDSKDDVNVTLVNTFNLICQKKYTDAEKRLQDLSASAMSDPFVNFAFAAMSTKEGKFAVAATYVQRATDLAPDFGWGFRTRAALQQKSLNDTAGADISYSKALAIEPTFLEAINALVDIRLVKNDFDGATDVASGAIAAEPNNGFNHYRLSQIYLQQWRLREAATELQKAIGLEPKDARSYRAVASIYRYQGKFDEAIENQKKAVEMGNDKQFDLLELANMEMSAGKDTAAVEDLKQILALNPNNQTATDVLERLLVKDGKFDELIANLKKLLEKDNKSAPLHERLGNALSASGKMEEAVDEYKEAANLNQSDPVPHRKIGAIRIAQKDYNGAAKEYMRALQINANSVPDLVALGFCYGQTDDYLQAEAAFVTALALHQLTQAPDSTVPPTTPDIMRALATLLFEEGRYADAASQFTSVCSMTKMTPSGNMDQFMSGQAVALRDRRPRAYATLEAAFLKLSPKEQEQQEINLVDTLIRCQRYDTAAKYLGLLNPESAKQFDITVIPAPAAPSKESGAAAPPKAALSAQEQSLIYICWSRIFRHKNDLNKADKAARLALDVSGKDGTPHSDALWEMAEVNLAKGNLDEATKNAEEAVKVNPKSYKAYEVLGRIALKRGKTKDAIANASKALELNPYFTEAYLLLGTSQIAANDMPGAESSFQKAVNLYPGNIQTHEALLTVLKKLQKTAEAKKEESVIGQLKGLQ